MADPGAIAAVQAATADAELLIADGHHRYETMQAYAEERDREGAPGEEHRYILMCLVALEDPGLTIFPTHRLVERPRRRRARSPCGRSSSGTSTARRYPSRRSPRDPGEGILRLGYFDRAAKLPLASDAASDQAIADVPCAGHASPTASWTPECSRRSC